MNRQRARGGAGTLLLAGLFILAIAAAAWIYTDYRRFTDAPLAIAQPDATLDIAKGASFRDIVQQIDARGLSHAHPWYWRALGEQSHVAAKLHAGEYALTVGLTPRELLRRMAAGEVVQHRFTIVDGWTVKQLRSALGDDAALAQTLRGVSDGDLAQKLAIADGHPEGWFLPETYAYVKGESDLDVLKRAHAAMTKLLDEEWPKRDASAPLDTPYQALILASIVEKETARADERPAIAGVFARRLKIGMRLQTDPSVIYGLGESYDGNIRRRDLDADTPYNTYTRVGLPPTPIALPGRPAIEAALHPANGDALYFVARGDGSHAFSSSLEAHNRAVAQYQLHHAQ